MKEIEIVGFTPTPEPLFRVVYTPRNGKRKRELSVIGAVLSKVTVLEGFGPVTHFELSPVFIYRDRVVLGQSDWDPQRDGGELVITPIKRHKGRS